MPEAMDRTFYRSPAAAVAAPPETLAYAGAHQKDEPRVLKTCRQVRCRDFPLSRGTGRGSAGHRTR
jgi:hypothetical protein